MTFSVLAQGPGWVAIDKPPGVPVIPGREGPPERCVKALLELQLKARVWVVHRLDRDSSGVLLFALDAETHRALSMAWEEGTTKKRYLALVEGLISAEQRIDVGLVPARRNRMRVAKPGEEGKASQTIIRPQRALKNATLVEAEPLTGRTHQIRVHLLSIGHPLLVDPQYTKRAAGPGGLQRTPLHASWLQFSLNGERHEVAAPLPADLQSAVDALS